MHTPLVQVCCGPYCRSQVERLMSTLAYMKNRHLHESFPVAEKAQGNKQLAQNLAWLAQSHAWNCGTVYTDTHRHKMTIMHWIFGCHTPRKQTFFCTPEASSQDPTRAHAARCPHPENHCACCHLAVRPLQVTLLSQGGALKVV